MSRAAFEAVYQREIGWVLNTLRRLGVASANLPDEAQKTFTAVWRQRESYDPERPVRPWLFGFAYRTVRDHRRESWRRRAVLDEVESVSEAAGADDALEASRRRAIVLAALAEMDLDRRAVFVMIDIDEATAPAAAEALAIPLGTVYSRLRLAREDFAAAVNRLRRRRGER
ncbi:MAG: RNA polymerase sigma factor [Polyangiales bacterium]